jgi:hypothetical protein
VRRCLLGIGLFGACGLVGPVLRYAVWPFMPATPSKGSPDDVVFFLILLTWPTMLAAVAPTAEGRTLAEFVSIGWNVALFAVLGCIVAGVARKPSLVWGALASVDSSA